VQERRVHDLLERQKAGNQQFRQFQARSAAIDVDLKARDAKIEKYRQQQQNAKNNKEYQAFLVEINTAKLDRGKVEEDALKVVGQLEQAQKDLAIIATQLQAEQARLVEMKANISDRLAALQAEIEQVRPARDSAAEEVKRLSDKALQVYERLAERYDGEAVAPIAQPDPRREAYDCTACNMELVTDVYNKLKTRDDLTFCPNCGRILYVPIELAAPATPKPKPAPTRAPPTGRKSSSRSTDGASVDPVKAELHRLLTRAAGESARNAIAAGNNPMEFEVHIEGKFLGHYKGQNLDNFRRTARFCLQEAGIIKEMDVWEKGQGPHAQKAAAQAAAANPPAPTTKAVAPEPTAPDALAAEVPAPESPAVEAVAPETPTEPSPGAAPRVEQPV
jgi:hypothetical protein